MKRIALFLHIIFLCASAHVAALKAPLGQVTAAIVDVRAHPSRQSCGTHYYHDFNQTTQLLWGEQVHIHAKKPGWFNVEIPDQKIFCKKKKKLMPCSGWVESRFIKMSDYQVTPAAFVKTTWAPLFGKRNTEESPVMHVCMGTPLVGFCYDEHWWCVDTPDHKKLWIARNHVRPINAYVKKKDRKHLRSSLVKEATTFLGYPYRWGGRSVYFSQGTGPWLTSGVDCASLVHLLYQSHGIFVPRNSTGLYQMAKPIDGSKCQPGDLVFLSRRKSAHDIFHVLLYLGNNQLLEAIGEGDLKKVRVISSSKRLGAQLSKLKNGQSNGKYSIFLGTFLS